MVGPRRRYTKKLSNNEFLYISPIRPIIQYMVVLEKKGGVYGSEFTELKKFSTLSAAKKFVDSSG